MGRGGSGILSEDCWMLWSCEKMPLEGREMWYGLYERRARETVRRPCLYRRDGRMSAGAEAAVIAGPCLMR